MAKTHSTATVQKPGARPSATAMMASSAQTISATIVIAAQVRNPERMNDVERHEGQHRERNDRERAEPRRQLEQEQIERRHVPQRRKAAKIIVRRLHLPVGEIERAGDDDERAERNRQNLRQQPAGGDGIGRHEHVGEDIDDEIEHVAGPARQQFRGTQPPRKSAVDAVDDERDAEPDEHLWPIRAHGGDQRQQRAGGAAGGEDVDRKGDRAQRNSLFGDSVGSMVQAYTSN